MSMSNDELQQLLLATFADQAKEQLQTINQRLLALEKAGDDERGPLLEEIFREAHSLKGASRAVSLDRVEAVAHKLESLFSVIQNGSIEPDAKIFDVAYQALDAITALVEEGLTGAENDVDVESICALLAAAEAGPSAEVQEEAPAEEPAPAVEEKPEPVAEEKPEPVAEEKPAPAKKAPAKRAPAKKAEPKAEEPDPTPETPDPTPAPKKAAPKKAATPKAEVDETVRVATSKLDALMAQVGELLAARIGAEHRSAEVRSLFDSLFEIEESWRKTRPARTLELALEGDESALADARALVGFLESSDEKLKEVRAGLGELRRKFESDSRRMAQVTTDLQDDVRRTRMLPVSTVFDTFPRMVRDMTRELKKEVELVIEGGETEVDKQVLEQLRSPLTHMVRNCVDHGMESPDDREQAGKKREGRVVLRAGQRAADLIIEVIDDGAGIDVEKVKAKAIEKGVITAENAEGMSEREALWLIFRSGFSTKQEVTDLSGRGVGMDVVREHIERLHGMIDVESTLGEGSKFTLSVPLSVATTRCLLVQAGGQVFGIPITNVERIVRLTAEDIGHTEGREAIRIDERPMALLRLAGVLGLPAGESEGVSQPAIILGSADRRAAFLVDGLLGAQEIATKTLPKPLIRVRHIAAATIVGTGEIVPILNVLDLLKASGKTAPAVAPRKAAKPESPVTSHESAEPKAPKAEAKPAGKQSILVVDDSVPIRTFEKALLEAAGYDVTAASDGLEAWNMLQSKACDLIVSDVEMPNMTGFELTEKVRGDSKLKDMPLVLVTTLSSDEDRKRGIDAGADAYVIKGSAEQDHLLDTVKRLI
jgi:two-component system, chemotaxis family, sensor kinase CheA